MRHALLALLFVVSAAHAEPTALKWGWEVWTCGTVTFTARLGDGRHVWLRSISGTMSASPTPAALALPSSDRVLRQSLTSIYSPFLPPRGQVETGWPQDAPSNHAIDQHLWAGNLKQIGLQTVNVPVWQAFDPPIGIPGGIVRVTVMTATYGNQSADPVQCLDTEGQLVFTFE